ncbi:MAG: DUF3788 domain-containing protein [Oscillospiraceae bacterium]|jgi:AraC family transcriptional regulator|nr:DUF3788 domain-containing protein [Oscillospiraceae bacterium]
MNTEWKELHGLEHEPSEAQIKEYVNTPLFDELDGYLRQTYKVKPKVVYSGCKMDGGAWQGWNIKYQKSGKSLCTLYPKQGYLLLLITIGVRGVNEAELLMPTYTEYIQNLYRESDFHGSKYFGIELRDESVLCDVKSLIGSRVRTK